MQAYIVKPTLSQHHGEGLKPNKNPLLLLQNNLPILQPRRSKPASRSW